MSVWLKALEITADQIADLQRRADQTACEYVRENVLALSKRWPNHTIEYVSGMGTECLWIYPIRKMPRGAALYYGAEDFHNVGFIERMKENPFAWVDFLKKMGENTCLTGNNLTSFPYCFVFKAKNGNVLEDSALT